MYQCYTTTLLSQVLSELSLILFAEVKVKHFINKMTYKFSILKFWIKMWIQLTYIISLNPMWIVRSFHLLIEDSNRPNHWLVLLFLLKTLFKVLKLQINCYKQKTNAKKQSHSVLFRKHMLCFGPHVLLLPSLSPAICFGPHHM
jgi:hypothetical protein